MNRFSIQDFYNLNNGQKVMINQNECSGYIDLLGVLKTSHIKDFYWLNGNLIIKEFIGLVRSMIRTDGKFTAAYITLEDCTGELSVYISKEILHQLLNMDLNMPIKLRIRFKNTPPLPSKPAYNVLAVSTYH